MLEEVLNNPNGSPSETSRALLSFVRQEFPLGGTAAEARFVHFFPSLLERVFGPVIANSLSREHEFTAEELKLIGAAWMMHYRPWTSSSSTSEASTSTSMSYSPYSTNASSAPKLESDPVIQLLSSPLHVATKTASKNRSESESVSAQQSSGRALSFFQILTCQSDLELHIVRNAQSSFPFTELPRDMQKALIHLVEISSTESPVRLSVSPTSPQKLTGCLCINPLQQKEFVRMMRQIISRYSFGFDRGGAGAGFQHSVSSNIHSPTLSSGRSKNQPYSPASAQQDVTSMKQNLLLNLSLCEYYFMLFCRFPLVLGKMNQVNKKSASSGSLASYGANRSRYSGLPFGEKAYFHLLRDYIKYYFPHDYEGGDKVYSASTRTQMPTPHNRKYETNELFVRLMIGYWLEKHVYTNAKDATANLSLEMAGLESSYDLAQLLPVQDMWSLNGGMVNQSHQSYDAPPKQAQRATKILVEHLVCDPAIARYCRDFGKWEEMKESSGADKHEWPISLPQSIIQPSLYNYIRTGMRYGPIHVSRSSFYAAMDLWLMWLEPWNVQRKKVSGATMQAKELFHNVATHMSSPKRTSNSTRQKVQQYSVFATPKPNQASKYTDVWEPYVAANLHFYLVPLAIFLRRARELDFTRGDFQKSMDHLNRVIRVFTPKLVKSIDLLLDNQEAGNKLRIIVNHHEDALGQFCPARSKDGAKKWNLKMLQEEMHNLLEEITIQHEKTVGEQHFIERIVAKVEGVFGSKAEEIVISKLVQKAKVIVKFPQDYEVVPSAKRRNGLFRNPSSLDKAVTDSNYSPERESNGIITDKGREQILYGSRMCDPMDVNFLGDPMYARPKSNEIEILVKWALLLSNKLNVYFGLDVPQQSKLYGIEKNVTTEQLAKEGEEMNKVGLFRFNLRFIADKRNWITMFVIWRIVWWKLTG